MQLRTSTLGCRIGLRLAGLGHGSACLFAFATPGCAVLHDVAVSLLALLCAAAACLGTCLVGEACQRTGASHQGGREHAEFLAIEGQFVRLGVMLTMFASARFQMFQTVVRRLVASPDTFAEDFQMLVDLVIGMFMFVVVLLRRSLVPAGHEQTGRSRSHPAQEFSTVHGRPLLHDSEFGPAWRTAKPYPNTAIPISKWRANQTTIMNLRKQAPSSLGWTGDHSRCGRRGVALGFGAVG